MKVEKSDWTKGEMKGFSAGMALAWLPMILLGSIADRILTIGTSSLIALGAIGMMGFLVGVILMQRSLRMRSMKHGWSRQKSRLGTLWEMYLDFMGTMIGVFCPIGSAMMLLLYPLLWQRVATLVGGFAVFGVGLFLINLAEASRAERQKKLMQT